MSGYRQKTDDYIKSAFKNTVGALLYKTVDADPVTPFNIKLVEAQHLSLKHTD
jgi:hypothetical protein